MPRRAPDRPTRKSMATKNLVEGPASSAIARTLSIRPAITRNIPAGRRVHSHQNPQVAEPLRHGGAGKFPAPPGSTGQPAPAQSRNPIHPTTADIFSRRSSCPVPPTSHTGFGVMHENKLLVLTADRAWLWGHALDLLTKSTRFIHAPTAAHQSNESCRSRRRSRWYVFQCIHFGLSGTGPSRVPNSISVPPRSSILLRIFQR